MFTRSLYILAAIGLGVSSVGCSPSNDRNGSGGPSGPTPVASTLLTGNGGPSGSHFTLNIIGVPKGKSASMTSGSRIFVPLTGSTKILLSEGDFAVLDGNATDGSGAFQLPNPDPTNSGTTTYSVFARALGKPGGSSKLTTAATDPVTGETFYSTESAVFVRTKGGSKFTNVSQQLLYVYADIDADGDLDRVPLFDDRLQDYFWQYDNNGMKLVQLRFYEVTTTVK
ncbi:MAG: hypothetical protein ACAI25_06950 [Planctomycetota bacterium]